jgi:cell division protein FtsN
MSNPERGAYTPPTADQPLSFDARQPVRGRGPAPMMLFASALVLFILVAAIVVFYRSGVSHSAGAPPTVGTPIGAIKGAAPAESQPTDPAQGLQIYQQAEGQAAPSQPNFVPPPEQPQARINPTGPIPLPPAAPAPGAPVAALPSATPNLKPSVTATAPAVKILPAAQAPAPVAVKPAAPIPAKPVAPVPAKPMASVPAKPAPAPAITTKPPAAAPTATAKLPASKPAPATPAATSGAASVQIGAFSSQALADKGWNDAAKIAPGAAAGKGKKVEAVPKGGATLYRTTVTGFGSRAAATAFCDQLKAAGKSCFVK